jgi:hypothetical protein
MIVVIELVDGWEVFVLLDNDLPNTRIRESVSELLSLNRDNILSDRVKLRCISCLIESFLQLLNSLLLFARETS